MFAHAIAEVNADRKGIHVIWAGPRQWLYSKGGWTIQRRIFQREEVGDCVALNPTDVNQLRVQRQLAVRHGVLTLRDGRWLAPLNSFAESTAISSAEVVTLELGLPQRIVSVRVDAAWSFIVGLREGRAVAVGSVASGQNETTLLAPGIDTVVINAIGLKELLYCLAQTPPNWSGVPIVKKLQIPIRELMSLANADEEFAEAKSRLLHGEELDRAEFESLTEILRALVKATEVARPIDVTMLMRETAADDAQELCGLDPLRSLLIHPKWRRVLGFAWFDNDPELVPGKSYEYRVTGEFPSPDVLDRVFGFHTVPSATALPAEVYLEDLRLRFPQPKTVERENADNGKRRQTTRRGVALANNTEPWWQVASLDQWSAVIDFPQPVTSVVLEVNKSHDLKFAFGSPWLPPSGISTLPAGPRAAISFPAPVHQLLLTGRGFLKAIRMRATTGEASEITKLFCETGPIRFLDSPLPDPPLFATISNLQQARAIELTDQPSTPLPAPHDLGFEVRWRPAPGFGLVAWPPDLAASPPLEATLFQIEQRQVAPSVTDWLPVGDEENYTVGDRAFGKVTPPVVPGVDLMSVFPEIGSDLPGAFDLFWRDVFDFDETGGDAPELTRRLPPLGTRHQYRVRAVDAIGRPSATWVESNTLRLEKHVPPPLPAAPNLTPADQFVEPTITGVRARVIIRGAPDVTPQEELLLGGHQNAIVLTWGWHDEQRKQDPYAREFRIYQTRQTPGQVRAKILGVVPLADGQSFEVAIQAERAFAQNAASGSVIETGAQCRVLSHGPGPSTNMVVRALERDANAVVIAPSLGAFQLPIRISPDQTRPRSWANRVAIRPIDHNTVYSHTFFDLFNLSADHPRDVVQVGVTSADSQDYVPDPLTPDFVRPGNESPIVPVTCEGRWYGRPVVVDVPALDPVPVLVTPEPRPQTMNFRLDLSPYTTLPSTAQVRPERVSDDVVYRAYRVDAGRVLAKVVEPLPGEVDAEVIVANAMDRAAVIAALEAGDVSALEDRFVVFLASAHPQRARLFQAATRDPIVLDQFDESLPNRNARWVYRFRLADAAGRLSSDGLTARVIVRVPSTSEIAAPVRVERGGPRAVLRIAGGSEVTHVAVFSRPLESRSSARETAQILRVRSGRAAPEDLARLRLRDGTLLTPSMKSLSDADVVVDGPFRIVTIDVPAGQSVRLWACAVTRDGVMSPLGGPWRFQGAPA